MVLHLTDDHRTLLRLVGTPYLWFYGVAYSSPMGTEMRNVGLTA
jgi:hypothetical protein